MTEYKCEAEGHSYDDFDHSFCLYSTAVFIAVFAW